MNATRIDKLLKQPTITVEQLAVVLDCGRDVAYSKVRAGEIKSIRLGRLIRVPTAPLRRLLGMEVA